MRRWLYLLLAVVALGAGVPFVWLAYQAHHRGRALARLAEAGGDLIRYDPQSRKHTRVSYALPGLWLPWRKRINDVLVTNREFSDADMAHFGAFTDCTSLKLDDTQVTDAGLGQLNGMTGLKEVNLEGINVTDAGLQHLHGSRGLQRLVLSRTGITDAGLEHLKGFTNLETLWLNGTQVTDAGVEDLQRALPQVTIMR